MLSLPAGSRTVDVQVIYTTAQICNIPTSVIFQPSIKGWDSFNGRCYTFLITHTDSTGGTRRVLFDLGVRKDWKNLAPETVKMVEGWRGLSGPTVKVDKDVSQILSGNGVDLERIEAVIWSHGHYDHIGNMQTFPSDVDLIVGPGIKDAFMPGWPKREVTIQESDFAGRNVREMSFEGSDLRIGGFRALDFFGDGSFYLLDAPGVGVLSHHAIGHMNALARTTHSPDTFMFLAGDSFHHASELRPATDLKLPRELDLEAFGPSPRPYQIFETLQPKRAFDKPFVSPNDVISHNKEQAMQTISKIQPFDADDRCLVSSAHDESLYTIMDYFPKYANSWQQKGWKEKARWLFLNDFAEAVRVSNEPEA